MANGTTGISDEEERRVCAECGQSYTIADFRAGHPSYFDPPHRYDEGCKTYCLACWLGVGPKDIEKEP